MVIAVPTFAHRRDGEPADIVALHGGILDMPVLMAVTMGDVRDVPMHGEADGDPADHAPNKPGQSPEPEQDDRDGDLMKHPRLFEKPVERIIANPRSGVENRRLFEN